MQTTIKINAKIHSIKILFFTNGVIPDINDTMLIIKDPTEIPAVIHEISCI